MTFFREELPRLGPDMECCIGLELDPARRRLKIIAMGFSLLELVEIVRVACVSRHQHLSSLLSMSTDIFYPILHLFDIILERKPAGTSS